MTPQQIEALNIAGQCRATASSPLAKNILVDEGNGLLTELLLDAARIIEALAQPEQPSVPWSAALESVWGEPEQEPVVHDPLPRACNLAGVDYQTFLKIKAYMPVAPPQPERHELQAKGEHPAPCARHCEANAFKIVIKNLKAQLAKRKPLTDEEIDKLLGPFPRYADEWSMTDFIRFARAIEAAHGIKE